MTATELGTVRGGDPMYALLEGIAHDGDAGRACSPTSASPLPVGPRDCGSTACAAWRPPPRPRPPGPTSSSAPSTALLDDAATVASAFVNHVGSRDPDRCGSLRQRCGQPLGGRRSSASTCPPCTTPCSAAAADERRATAELVEIADQTRGDGTIAEGALFDEAALDLVTDLAVGTTDGLATIRAGLDLHQRTRRPRRQAASPTVKSPTSTASSARRSPTPPAWRPTSSSTPGTGPRPVVERGTT